MANAIEQYLKAKCNQINDEKRKWNIELNSRPCSYCGHKELVQKFRNVVGKIEGYINGTFFLFGGSVTGEINGYTKTLPVLSCRNCENEREIFTVDFRSKQDFFWSDMLYFYQGMSGVSPTKSCLKKIDRIYLDHPYETREYMKTWRNWEYDFYNELPEWEPKVWAKAGFKINKIEKRFLFWEWEIWPQWKDLSNPPTPDGSK